MQLRLIMKIYEHWNGGRELCGVEYTLGIGAQKPGRDIDQFLTQNKNLLVRGLMDELNKKRNIRGGGI